MVMTTPWDPGVRLPLLGHQRGPNILLPLHIQLPPASDGDTEPGLALETEGDGGLVLARQEETVA